MVFRPIQLILSWTITAADLLRNALHIQSPFFFAKYHKLRQIRPKTFPHTRLFSTLTTDSLLDFLFWLDHFNKFIMLYSKPSFAVVAQVTGKAQNFFFLIFKVFLHLPPSIFSSALISFPTAYCRHHLVLPHRCCINGWWTVNFSSHFCAILLHFYFQMVNWLVT